MHTTRINIALNGRHFMRVVLGENGASDGDRANVVRVFNELVARFPAHEGFSVTASQSANAMYDVTDELRFA